MQNGKASAEEQISSVLKSSLPASQGAIIPILHSPWQGDAHHAVQWKFLISSHSMGKEYNLVRSQADEKDVRYQKMERMLTEQEKYVKY